MAWKDSSAEEDILKCWHTSFYYTKKLGHEMQHKEINTISMILQPYFYGEYLAIKWISTESSKYVEGFVFMTLFSVAKTTLYSQMSIHMSVD